MANLRARGVGCAGDRGAVVALGVVTELDVAFALGLFFDEVGGGALGAGAGDGAVVEGEVALRVARAGVEDAAARAALDELSFAAAGALHAGRLRRRGL